MTFFHTLQWLHPWWLITIPLHLVLAYWLWHTEQGSLWVNIIDPELLKLLRTRPSRSRSQGDRWAILISLLLISIAMAGPSWQKQKVPAYAPSSSWVFLLDLDSTMLATDTPPNRITLARIGLHQMFDALQGQQAALIAFSSEPFTVTPLTQDIHTLSLFLPDLNPGIMPVEGKNLQPALALAGQLLAQTSGAQRHIVVLTDGLNDKDLALKQLQRLRQQGIKTDFVGVGTTGGAPSTNAQGQWQSKNGIPVWSRLPVTDLQKLALDGGGMYVDAQHLNPLLELESEASHKDIASKHDARPVIISENDGFWLLVPLLILAAFSLRQGLRTYSDS